MKKKQKLYNYGLILDRATILVLEYKVSKKSKVEYDYLFRKSTENQISKIMKVKKKNSVQEFYVLPGFKLEGFEVKEIRDTTLDEKYLIRGLEIEQD